MGRPRSLREVRTCPQCAATFEAKVGEQKIYCTAACYHAKRTGRERGAYAVGPDSKACEACGGTFRVGGRGNPPRRQRLCSDECQRASRFRTGAMARELPVPDAAYLAGLIDGEGSIMLISRQNGGAHLRLSVANTDRPILDWTTETTGIGGVYLQRTATERTKASYSWRSHGDGAASVIRQIRPYLRIKARQADLALEHHTALRDPARKANLLWQQENMAAMKLMNKRGGS